MRAVVRCSGLVFGAVVVFGCPGGDPEPEGWEVAREVDASEGALLAIWGSSPESLRAVGGQISAVGDAGVGVVLRRGDGDWLPESLPADTPVLNWIHGVDDTVWAVGNAGAALRLSDGSWVREDTPVDVPLWGVWVVSATEAWAVGGDAFDSATDGIVVHYAAGTWAQVDLPALDRPMPALFKVWGASASDLHAVGDNGVIVHFDGTDWTQVESGSTEDLISLWGTGPTEIVAVGGRTSGVMSRYDGTRWTTTTLPRTPALNGVWMGAEGDAVLAGERGVVSRLPAGTADPETIETPSRLDVLHATFALPSGLVVVVGGTLQGAPPFTGVILEGTGL